MIELWNNNNVPDIGLKEYEADRKWLYDVSNSSVVLGRIDQVLFVGDSNVMGGEESSAWTKKTPLIRLLAW